MKIIGCLFPLVIFFPSLTSGTMGIDSEGDGIPNQEIFGRAFLTQRDWLRVPADQVFDPRFIRGRKSLGRGLLYSLVLPGAGEFYSRAPLKGVLFTGIELAAWISYGIHQRRGKNWKKRFISFADREWDYQSWKSWWQSLSLEDQARFPRFELPSDRNDQFYDLIGKYEKFNAGWRDVNWIPGLYVTGESKAGEFYRSLRQNSNSEYKLAAFSITALFANHILSGLDALWSVTRLNHKVQSRSRIDYVFIDEEPILLAGISISW